MKQALFGCGTRDTTASVGILALRLCIGLMMLMGHGIEKIQNFHAKLNNPDKDFYTPDFFPLHWMSETVSLVACIVAEVGAAALIVIGLATRPAAFVLGFTMVVAAFGALAQEDFFGGQEKAILYLVAMIAIILTGAGRFSLDAIIGKDRRSRLKIAL